jgi:myo-inositol 2-dehydrogenase/D-chiro-inositol 1-dehydrogenase
VARQFHLPALLADPRADLVAVADPDRAALDAVPGLAGAAVTDDVAALIGRDDVEAVVVCAPSALHAELAEAVLAAGRHLYLEKPVGLDLGRAERLAAVAATAPAVSCVGFNYRFNPAFSSLRDRAGRGEIGAVRGARSWHHEPGLGAAAPGWKRSRGAGGGVAIDLASHSADMLRWLLGEEIAAVEEATIASRVTEGDDLLARLRTTSGVSAEIRCSYLHGRGHRWELDGEEGALVADRWPPRTRRRRRRGSGVGLLRRGLLGLPIPRRERSFALALGSFLGACLGDERDARLATVADGVRSLETVLEIERAAGLETLGS